MEGYKFDGWYDDVVGGTKITVDYRDDAGKADAYSLSYIRRF